MIDLHCHILPGIDDGSPDLATSMEMARMASADGITTIACTPHISPGVYDNAGPQIDAAREELAEALRSMSIPLRLVLGADAHVAPDLLAGLRAGRVPSINHSRYVLLEPPHHVLPPRFDAFVFTLVAAGYIPVLTHPERLTWIENHYPVLGDLAAAGALMQVTAGSITGQFGRRARYWSDRLLDEDLVQIIASDAHDVDSRPPVLSKARDIVARRRGDDYVTSLVLTNPQRILENVVVSPPARPATRRPDSPFWRRIWPHKR